MDVCELFVVCVCAGVVCEEKESAFIISDVLNYKNATVHNRQSVPFVEPIPRFHLRNRVRRKGDETNLQRGVFTKPNKHKQHQAAEESLEGFLL